MFGKAKKFGIYGQFNGHVEQMRWEGEFSSRSEAEAYVAKKKSVEGQMSFFASSNAFVNKVKVGA